MENAEPLLSNENGSDRRSRTAAASGDRIAGDAGLLEELAFLKRRSRT